MAIIEISEIEDHETFRNELASIAHDGRRKWIYARKPSGKFTQYRTYLSYVLLAFLFFAPYLKINNHQFMLFNIIERKFVIFGIPFWTQDFYLALLLILFLLVTLVVYTSIFGRIWCGWLCPQTVFMEMIFRKIEFAIEGSPKQQITLDNGAWTKEKVWKKGLKHSIFFAISFIIANTFLSYIIGSDQLWKIILDPPQQHLVGLTAITVFSIVFYAVFARFREQACIIVCPYGRYQSALVDEDTIAVTYDFKRGEPRGKFTKEDKAAQLRGEKLHDKGDCIDCHQCVTVCPTGIDIRNGIQLECVNCTACIDACDDVMTKIQKPKGLIRYASNSSIKDGKKIHLSARSKAYGVVWLLVMTVLVTLFMNRKMLHVLVLRQPGTTFAVMSHDKYANFFHVQLLNKKSNPKEVAMKIISPQNGELKPLSDLVHIDGQQEKEGRMMLIFPKSSLSPTGSTDIVIEVSENGTIADYVKTKFISPNK